MTDWASFTLGGVEPHQKSVFGLELEFGEFIDTNDWRETATGTSKGRAHWQKRRIAMSGSGPVAMYLPGLDYSASMTLNLRWISGKDVDDLPLFSDTNLTVLARPPQVHQSFPSAQYTWTMECIEVDAAILHNLQHVFTLGGVTPHSLAQLDFSQQIEPVVGGGNIRLGDGSLERREHWRKSHIVLAGGGWVPLNGLDGLTYSGPLTLQVSELSSIDGDGNPVYSTSSYSVLSNGPRHNWDMISRLYTWTLECWEV